MKKKFIIYDLSKKEVLIGSDLDGAIFEKIEDTNYFQKYETEKDAEERLQEEIKYRKMIFENRAIVIVPIFTF